MYFVDNEDLVTIARGSYSDRVDDHVSDIVHACVGSGVYLNHVHRPRGGDVIAGGTIVTGLDRAFRRAVEGLGEDARRSRLSNSSCACEKIGVVTAAAGKGVFDRSSDRLLADHLIERLGPELSRDYL